MVTSASIRRREMFCLTANVAAAAAMCMVGNKAALSYNNKTARKSRRKRKHTIGPRVALLRRRMTMEESFARLGTAGFRRVYRMYYESFSKLHTILQPGMDAIIRRGNLDRNRDRANKKRHVVSSDNRNRVNMKLPPVVNGPITTSMRLGIALRFFKGCPSYDVHDIFGVSHASVIESIWIVVQAVNEYIPFNLEYPADHNKQLKIAQGFRAVSSVGFSNCAGAIDGILVWIHKPTAAQAEISGIGQQKFYCGRKGKFGLNCQAVADVRGRFLDLSINYGGAASDCLAFEASSLCHRLEQGLLAPGLNLFGDNAYLNTNFMATPFPNVSKGDKDNYNFFQSQVRSLLLLFVSQDELPVFFVLMFFFDCFLCSFVYVLNVRLVFLLTVGLYCGPLFLQDYPLQELLLL